MDSDNADCKSKSYKDQTVEINAIFKNGMSE